MCGRCQEVLLRSADRQEGEPGYAGQCAHGASSGLSDGSAGRVDQGESLRRSDGGDQEEPFLGEAEEACAHGSAAESSDGVRYGQQGVLRMVSGVHRVTWYRDAHRRMPGDTLGRSGLCQVGHEELKLKIRFREQPERMKVLEGTSLLVEILVMECLLFFITLACACN